MKISYNWLKEYLDFKEDHESIGEKLTSLGLEVEGIKKFQSIPGGLEGVGIGKTKSIKKHPNADRLKITLSDLLKMEVWEYNHWLSYFMIETAIVGKLININPFNQPAVEQVKTLTKKFLNCSHALETFC